MMENSKFVILLYTPDVKGFCPNVSPWFQNPAISLDNSSVTINLKLELANQIPGFWNQGGMFGQNPLTSGVPIIFVYSMKEW